MLDGDGAGVEEDQHDHKPEPGGRLREREQGHHEGEEDDHDQGDDLARVIVDVYQDSMVTRLIFMPSVYSVYKLIDK